jgi:hypothetical protein
MILMPISSYSTITVFVYSFFFMTIVPIIGYLIGLKIESPGNFNLKNKQLNEIKKLLIERKKLTEIEEKIDSWKNEGYNVSELERLIEDTK